MNDSTVFVTGGAGFIGAALVRHLIDNTAYQVVVIDCMNYASDPRRLVMLPPDRWRLEQIDIANAQQVARVFSRYSPAAVVNLAAESHVDRSIDSPSIFVRSNVVGTQVLLDHAYQFWSRLGDQERQSFRLLHVSTDEVYGSLDPSDEPFTEDHPHRPNSPYAASKSASDQFARAYNRTYGLPVIISNCSNNYGPYQFPEKLIPLMVIKGLRGESLPIYGTGEHVRDWLHVDDHAEALLGILAQGIPGRTYNVGGNTERTNSQVVREICQILDDLFPSAGPHERFIQNVPDRPGHDARYAIDTRRVRNECGWVPQRGFTTGLRETVEWYVANESWWRPILQEVYGGERLGISAQEER